MFQPQASRLAQPEDAESIGRVRVDAWKTAYVGFMPDIFLDALDPNTELSQLRAQLAAATPCQVTRVIESEGDVVAFSLLGLPRYEAPSETVELWAVNVMPAYWRRGYGAALVEVAFQDARAKRGRCLELWCIEGNNRARSLYKRFGFAETGTSRTNTKLTGHPLYEIQLRVAL